MPEHSPLSRHTSETELQQGERSAVPPATALVELDSTGHVPVVLDGTRCREDHDIDHGNAAFDGRQSVSGLVHGDMQAGAVPTASQHQERTANLWPGR